MTTSAPQVAVSPAANAGVRNRLRAGRSAADKYLAFMLGSEHFAMPILKVQEIIGLMDVTPVPRQPAWVRGVINLRGKVIPVIDLRRKFGMEAVTDTKRTCIIVAQVASASGPLVIGTVVDVVSEVQNIAADAIEPPPTFGSTVDTTFITGMGKTAKKVVMILDVDRVLSPHELAQTASVAAT